MHLIQSEISDSVFFVHNWVLNIAKYHTNKLHMILEKPLKLKCNFRMAHFNNSVIDLESYVYVFIKFGTCGFGLSKYGLHWRVMSHDILVLETVNVTV